MAASPGAMSPGDLHPADDPDPSRSARRLSAAPLKRPYSSVRRSCFRQSPGGDACAAPRSGGGDSSGCELTPKRLNFDGGSSDAGGANDPPARDRHRGQDDEDEDNEELSSPLKTEGDEENRDPVSGRFTLKDTESSSSDERPLRLTEDFTIRTRKVAPASGVPSRSASKKRAAATPKASGGLPTPRFITAAASPADDVKRRMTFDELDDSPTIGVRSLRISRDASARKSRDASASRRRKSKPKNLSFGSSDSPSPRQQQSPAATNVSPSPSSKACVVTTSTAAKGKKNPPLPTFFSNMEDSNKKNNNAEASGSYDSTPVLRRRSAPVAPAAPALGRPGAPAAASHSNPDVPDPDFSPVSTPRAAAAAGAAFNRNRTQVRRRTRLLHGGECHSAPQENLRRHLKRSAANVNPFAPCSLNISNSIKRAKLAEIDNARRMAGMGNSSGNGGSFTTPVTDSNIKSGDAPAGRQRPTKNSGGEDDDNKTRENSNNSGNSSNGAGHNPFNDSFHEAVRAHEAAIAAEKILRGGSGGSTSSSGARNNNRVAAMLDFSSPSNVAAGGQETPTGPRGAPGNHHQLAPLVHAPTPPPGLHPSLSSLHTTGMGPDLDPASPLSTKKRVRLAEVEISRYRHEFLELETLASGEFGTVKLARHRLDGMVYAVKITKQRQTGTGDKAVLNEIFAHAAMLRHRHVVRYYSSWVERGHIFIQNEYCDGGSLASVLRKRRQQSRPFQEWELRRLCVQVIKGLQYMHSKNLVHLDIKPDNIFLDLSGDAATPLAGDEDAAAVPAGGTGAGSAAAAVEGCCSRVQSSSSDDGDPSPMSLAASMCTPVASLNPSPEGQEQQPASAQAAADSTLGCQALAEASVSSSHKLERAHSVTYTDTPKSSRTKSRLAKALSQGQAKSQPQAMSQALTQAKALSQAAQAAQAAAVSSDSGHASDGSKNKAATGKADSTTSVESKEAVSSTPVDDGKAAAKSDPAVTPISPSGAAAAAAEERSPADGTAPHVSYKIGDLGHVASLVSSDFFPEEGDCRYMAPELMLHEVNRERLPKADVFSLALTLYECATLADMPKNSNDNAELYLALRNGSAPGLEKRSKNFQSLFKLMTKPDAKGRPSAGRILGHPFLRHNSPKARSNRELTLELASARRRVLELEQQLMQQQQQQAAAQQQQEPQPGSSRALTATQSASEVAPSSSAVPVVSRPAPTEPKSESTPRSSKRLAVGRGAKRSKSCFQIAASSHKKE